jgi:hypothetical protein
MAKKFITAFILSLLAFGLTACWNKKESSEPPSVATPASPSAPDLTPPAAPVAQGRLVEAPAKFNKTLVGTLNNEIDVQMKLTRDGKNLTGTYFYETIRDPIELEGTVEKDGTCKISEKTGEQVTGIFKGQLAGEEFGGATTIRFEGTWSKPNGEKAMPFTLKEQRFVISGGLLNLVSKAKKEENKKDHYEYEVDYPQLEGVKDARTEGFNKAVLNIVNAHVSRFKKEAPEGFDATIPDAQPNGLWIDYDVTLANDAVISVVFNESEYESGAAHPNSFSTTLNYDLQNSKEIKLRDLFNANSNYLQTISTQCQRILAARLKKQDAYIEETVKEGTAPKAENFQSWNITRKGLLFNFDPYEVAAYALGPQDALVSYENLKGLLKSDSPIAAFLDGSNDLLR